MSAEGKRGRFVDEYLRDLNATQAAVRAGYSSKTAYSQGQRLLKNVEVQEAIAEAQSARSARTEITADRVLRELAKIGFSDIRNVVVWRANVTQMVEDEDTGEERLAVTNEVRLIDADQITDEAAATISEISKTDKGGLKVKLHDKLGALDKIAKHLGMFVERREITGKDGGPIQHAVSAKDLDDDELARIALSGGSGVAEA